jgi:hypothetical protein
LYQERFGFDWEYPGACHNAVLSHFKWEAKQFNRFNHPRSITMKKYLCISALLLLSSVAHAFKYIPDKGFEVRFTPAEAQKRLDPVLPLSKKYQDTAEVTLKKVTVAVPDNGSRVHANASASLTLPGVAKPVSGEFKVETGLHYDGKNRGVYLIDPVVGDVRIPGNPAALTNLSRSVLTFAMKEYAAANPVYILPPTQNEGEILKLEVKQVTVTEGQFVVILGTK